MIKHTFRTLYLNIMQFVVAYKFVVCNFVSKLFEILFIVKNGVTKKK